MAQDSARPDFWDLRYRDGVTPWDAGGAPPLLARKLEGLAPGRALVPGCGAGYEVRLLAERGWEVLGIDFSPAALEAARRALGRFASCVRQADFFAFEGDRAPFDLLYERAFLCALPRAAWPRWAARCAQLVRPGGRLAGFFYFDDNQRGPPFGISREALEALLEGDFALSENEAVPAAQSIAVFQGKERWQAWTRRL
jgi:SAM-dependent methyltransferase